MAKPARRLGRGLDSLISDLRSADLPTPLNRTTSPTPTDSETTDIPKVRATFLHVDVLCPNPLQPRDNTKQYDITSITKSIQQSGMLQPIAVRSVSGRYEIIAGERRWRAAKALGMAQVPVLVREATDEQMLEFALVENIQREDLNAIDRAKAYRQFCMRFTLRPEQVAARLGEDRTTVVNYLRLLDLPQPVQTLVAAGKLSMGHARCLLGVSDDAKRLRLAESASENELSVRTLEEIVRREKTREGSRSPGQPTKLAPRQAHLRDLQRRFEEAVKTKVTIHEGKRKGTGRIVIEYYSLDDFDRIAEMLGVTPE